MHSSLKPSFALTIALGLLGVPASAAGQDLEACGKIEDLARAGDVPAALIEVGWCERGLNDLYYQQLLETLGVEIMGYAPGEGSVEAALGFSNVEITHSNGGDEISTTFTSGTGGADSPMSGLGALASLGNAFGIREEGVEQVRLGRLTGRLEDKGNGMYSLMVTLSGGEILTHEGTDGDVLQRFATEAIRLLNSYLDG